MKNVLLTIALALFCFRAAAQQYRPFVEEGKMWRVASISPRNDDLTYPVDHEYYFMYITPLSVSLTSWCAKKISVSITPLIPGAKS